MRPDVGTTGITIQPSEVQEEIAFGPDPRLPSETAFRKSRPCSGLEANCLIFECLISGFADRPSAW